MCFFALPMILGNILQQGYNVVDTWVVGHYIGSNALAAVGASFALMTCLTSALLGLCMGSGIVFSLCFGRNEKLRLQNSICAAFLLTVLTALFLTVSSLIGIDVIISWLNIPDEILGITKDYMSVVFLGIRRLHFIIFLGRI